MSIALPKDIGSRMRQTECDELNKYFQQGWEFVDSICQVVSAGSGSYYGAVFVILRREKK
jgi:hypothetical protein